MNGLFIYFVVWTISLNVGQYGSIEKTFEKKFESRKAAVAFIEKKPKQCTEIRLDSTLIDTTTREKTNWDTIINRTFSPPLNKRYYDKNSLQLLRNQYE